MPAARAEPLEPRRLLAGDVGVAADLRFGPNPDDYGGTAVYDLNSGGSRHSEAIHDLDLLPDGRAVLAGGEGSDAIDSGAVVVRLLPDGTPDPTFGDGGVVRLDAGGTGGMSSAAAVLSLDDGRLVVVGTETVRPLNGTAYDLLRVARLLPDGTLDSTFGQGGFAGDGGPSVWAAGHDVLPTDDGGYLVSASGFLFLKFDSNGMPDPTFGTDGRLEVPGAGTSDLTRLDDGSILAGGRGVVTRLRPDLTLDPGFGDGGAVRTQSYNSFSHEFDVAADGSIVLAEGRYIPSAPHGGNERDVVVRRFDASGQPDPDFGDGGETVIDWHDLDYLGDLTLLPDGKILLGATAADNRGVTNLEDFALARLLPDGAFDPTFGYGGTLVHPVETLDPDATDDRLHRLAVGDDGTLLAVGSTTVRVGDQNLYSNGNNLAVRRYLLDPRGFDLNFHGPDDAVAEGSAYPATVALASHFGEPLLDVELDAAYHGTFDPEALLDAPAPATASVVAGDDPHHTLALRAVSAVGLEVFAAVPVATYNLPPTLDPYTRIVSMVTGDHYRYSPRAYDAVLEDGTISIDYDGAAPPASGDYRFGPGTGWPTFSKRFWTAGTYRVGITLDDGDGGTATASLPPVHVFPVLLRAFYDVNGDGHDSAADYLDLDVDLLTSIAAFADLDGDGLRGPDDPVAQVFEDGGIGFAALPDGTHPVVFDLPAGLNFTDRLDPVIELRVINGRATEDVPLTHKAVLHGTLWRDDDGDGVRDPGEPPLAGRRVWVDTDNNGVRTALDVSRVTDDQGRYVLAGHGRTSSILLGHRQARQVVPDGWEPTSPAAGGALPAPDLDTGAARGSRHQLDFGSRPGGGGVDVTLVDPAGNPVVARAEVFVDLDDDGEFDPAEPVSEGGVLRLPVGEHRLLPLPWSGHEAVGGAAVVTVVDGQDQDVAIPVRDVPPRLLRGRYHFDTWRDVWLQFSEPLDISGGLPAASVVDLGTGLEVNPAFVSVSYLGRSSAPATLWVRFRDLPGRVLPDGNYRVTIPAVTAPDLQGTPPAEDVAFDFFVLTGDFNRDRRVDLADFTTLAGNFGRDGATFAQGDANYDGRVDLADFTLLAGRFGASLPPPGDGPGGPGDDDDDDAA